MKQKEPFLPLLRGLQRVIPIAQSQQSHEIVITLLSLEVYSTIGSIVSLLVESLPGAHNVTERFGRAWLKAKMHDDQGTHYQCQRVMTEGVTRSNSYIGRAIFRCSPQVDLTAHYITLHIDALQWERYDSQIDTFTLGELTSGSWRFEFSLAENC